MERKFCTHDWCMRVNISLLGICIVDAWLLYRGASGAAAVRSQASFYEHLASGLIDNTFDSRGMRTRTSQENAEEALGTTTSGSGTWRTPASGGGGRTTWHNATDEDPNSSALRAKIRGQRSTCVARGLAVVAGPRT